MEISQVSNKGSAFKRSVHNDWIIENPNGVKYKAGEDVMGPRVSNNVKKDLSRIAPLVWEKTGEAVFFTPESLAAKDWIIR